MARIKESFGKLYVNKGRLTTYPHTKYEVDRSRQFYIFNAVPMGKPRMSQSDKWKTNPNHIDPNKRQRPVIAQYWAYKDALLWQAKQMGFVMGEFIDAVYFSPMPNSWSEKKKDKMNGFPCQVKPDTDNITKGLKDIFNKNDSHIWKDIAEHRWATFGSILIYL